MLKTQNLKDLYFSNLLSSLESKGFKTQRFWDLSSLLKAEQIWETSKIPKEFEVQQGMTVNYPTMEYFCHKPRQKMGIFPPEVRWPLDVFWGRKSGKIPQILRIWDAQQAGITAKDQFVVIKFLKINRIKLLKPRFMSLCQ